MIIAGITTLEVLSPLISLLFMVILLEEEDLLINSIVAWAVIKFRNLVDEFLPIIKI
jgi:hypothetical protein